MGGMINREGVKENHKTSANPFKLFKGEEERQGFLNAALDPLDLTKPVKPPEPEALPPPPTAEDPEIAAARQKQIDIDMKRKGRRASILTSARGVEDDLGTVNRPRAAALLGQ